MYQVGQPTQLNSTYTFRCSIEFNYRSVCGVLSYEKDTKNTKSQHLRTGTKYKGDHMTFQNHYKVINIGAI